MFPFNNVIMKYMYLDPENPIGHFSWYDDNDITRDPIYKHGLTLITAWINNHMPIKI